MRGSLVLCRFFGGSVRPGSRALSLLSLIGCATRLVLQAEMILHEPVWPKERSGHRMDRFNLNTQFNNDKSKDYSLSNSWEPY